MKKKFESIKAEKFNALTVDQFQKITGGAETYQATTGTGTVTAQGHEYSYNGDVNVMNGNTVLRTGYWVVSDLRYVWP